MSRSQDVPAGIDPAVHALLCDPSSWPETMGDDQVGVIETHGAVVYLLGLRALKVKRAVDLGYLDFSTLENRHRFLEREFALNRANAPDLYRGVVAIVRGVDGRLALGGEGEPVEWALAMRRFDQSMLLSAVAERGGLNLDLARALADAVAASHRAAPRVAIGDASGRFQRLIAELAGGLARAGGNAPALVARTATWARDAAAAAQRHAALLDRRASLGLVRRCHGDLHLGNIVLWHGAPVLFDALEFNEDLATIDVLYDLAFLLMDLDRRGHRAEANAVMNRYVQGADFHGAGSDGSVVRGAGIQSADVETGAVLGDLEGLALLPLFLSARAAVRAMVALDRAAVQAGALRRATLSHAAATLDAAIGYLAPEPARLVAVGGLSGTGKSTLARLLAPQLGAAPGALHLRSDVVRKALAGLGELERLPPDAYTPESAAAVYGSLMRRAHTALAAGHSVVVDAVFQRPHERTAIEAVARELGIRFDGVWLTGDAAVLEARIRSRRGDASDADPDVLARQLARDLGPLSWSVVDADGTPAETLARAWRVLAHHPA